MTKLKKRIKIINSLPPEKKEKKSLISILITIISILILLVLMYITYTKITPFIFATNITNIIGKKTNITDCNTKDYIIINKDKSYTMSITNESCEQNYYEGNLIIKSNEIIFNKEIKGLIDNNNNIIIKNNIFESDKNE